MTAWEMSSMRVRILIVTTFWCIYTLGTTCAMVWGRNPVQNSSTVTYRITVLTNSSTTTCEKEFLSVAIDSNAAVRNWTGFDFSSKKLQNQVKALSPCDLRFGGIMADFLFFVPEYPTNPQGKPMLNNITVSDTPGSPTFTFYSLYGKDLTALTTFTRTVGCSLTFDFNVFPRSRGLWNTSNAELLLKYSSARGIQIPGFQLGNEPAHYPRLNNVNITPRNLSADYKVLRDLISRYPMYKNSAIYGPSVTDTGSSMTYLRGFIAADGANFTDETDIHHYYLDGRLAKLEDFLNITVLNSLKRVLNTTLDIIRTAKRPRRLRLSETSSCYGGGAPGLSNTYAAGFMWMDKLGISALYGLSRVVRQSLIGSSYQLISPWTFNPNPDFYLSVLFKRLVEGPVFPVTLTPVQELLRVYANCARRDIFSYPRGAIVVYFLNVGTEISNLALSQFPAVERLVFILTPGDDKGLTSSSVKLNGQFLSMTGEELPRLSPVTQTGDVTVPAQSFGFVVIPLANVPACINFHARSPK